MRLVTKVLLLGVAALVALCIAAFLALRFVDFNRYSDRLGGLLSELSGRDVRIEGPLRVAIGLPIRLRAAEVSLGNVGWGSRPEMATAQSVAVTLRLLPLLRGEVELAAVSLEGVDVLIERNASGAGNWEFGRPESHSAAVKGKPGSAQGSPGSLPRIERLELANARVTYRDAAAKRSLFVDLDRLALRSPAAGAPLEIALEAESEGAHAAFRGELSPPSGWSDGWPEGEGTIELSTAEPAALAAAFGAQLRTIPAASLSAGLGVSQRTIALRDIEARVGDSDLEGELTLSWLRKRPRLTGALRAERFLLDELLADKAESAQANKGDGGTPLPWEVLAHIDGDVSMSLKVMRLPSGGAAEDVVVKVSADDGNVDLSCRVGGTKKGKAIAEANVHAESATQRLNLTLRATDVSVEKLVSDDTVRGATVRADVRLSGHGASRRAIVRSLAGELLVEIGSGTFSGRFFELMSGDLITQVLDLVDPRARSSGPTHLDCAVARARARSGVLEFAKGIALETEDVKVIGAGTLDLASGDIDLALRTDPKGGAGVSVATVVDSLIRVRGTYADPKIEINPLGTARAALRVGDAVLTSGFGLIDDVLRLNLQKDVSPCLIASGEVPASDSAAEQVTDTAKGIGGAVRKGASSVGRGLKQLLDR